MTKNATAYTYDNADQMLTAGGVSYGYDANGNQTGRGADTFTYDHENRLTQTAIGGTAGAYAYNGGGLRTSRTLGAASVSYVWDQNSGLPRILQDSAGNSYVYGLDLISRTGGTGSQEYYVTDGLGSTTGLTTSTGTQTDTYGYDAFGAVRSRTGTSTNEFTYTGEQNDATGLEYLRARYYDNATGRFLGRDPLPLLQRYAYVGNNPVNLVDPSGMCHDAQRYAHPSPSATPAPTLVGEKPPRSEHRFDACSPLSDVPEMRPSSMLLDAYHFLATNQCLRGITKVLAFVQITNFAARGIVLGFMAGGPGGAILAAEAEGVILGPNAGRIWYLLSSGYTDTRQGCSR